MLYYVTLCYIMLRYVILCYVMLYYVALCYIMLHYIILCYIMLHSLTPRPYGVYYNIKLHLFRDWSSRKQSTEQIIRN
jgi:hypothetical protein